MLVWRRIAPEAYLEALVMTVKGTVRPGRWRMAFDRKEVGDQFQGRFFLVRSIRGLATLE